MNRKSRRMCRKCFRGPRDKTGHDRLLTTGYMDLGGDHPFMPQPGLIRICLCADCAFCWIRFEDECMFWWRRATPAEEFERKEPQTEW